MSASKGRKKLKNDVFCRIVHANIRWGADPCSEHHFPGGTKRRRSQTAGKWGSRTLPRQRNPGHPNLPGLNALYQAFQSSSLRFQRTAVLHSLMMHSGTAQAGAFCKRIGRKVVVREHIRHLLRSKG